MLGTRYQIKAGDTLWSIAHEHLGHGAQWPRIWRYNNRRDVIRATGHGIPDPDLIRAGSTILIPILPGQRDHRSSVHHHTHRTPQHTNPSTSAAQAPHSPSPQPLRAGNPATELKRELPHIYSPISIKYRLNDLTMPVIETPTATIEFRMTGDIVLMTDKRYPATYVSNGGRLETQISQQANVAFGQLIGDTRFIYDSKKKEVTVRSMLVSQSTTPNAPATAVGVEFGSSSPVPKLRAEVRFPKLEGRIGPFHYVAMSVAFVILITPKAHIPPSAPSPQAVRDAVRVREPDEGTNWGRVIGTGLVIGAGVIVVGTLVEDFFSGGVGVADDPASFAAAGASLTRGLAMLRGAATTALPRAAVPAAVHVGARVGLAH